MGLEIKWYIPHEIVYVRLWGVLDITDLKWLLNEYTSFFEKSPRPLVHTIYDTSEVTKGIPIKEVLNLVSKVKPHPKTGWTITVGEKDKLTVFTINAAQQMLRVRQRAFKSIDEAIGFLKDIDITIDWTKEDSSVLSKENCSILVQ